MAGQCDAMIVIGGKHSSNTRKLFEICKTECANTYFIEQPDDLDLDVLRSFHSVGITAGASTPNNIIKEVFSKMSETSFEQLLAEEQLVSIHNGQVIEGTVIRVKEDEIALNIGYKADGIVTRSEYTNTPGVDLRTLVKEGDTMQVKVLKVNDGDGQVALTYKRLAAERGSKRLEEAFNNKEVLTATVTDVLKGGLSLVVDETRVFIPASLVSDSFEQNLEKYKDHEIQFVITEFNPKRRRIIGDRKQLLVAKKKELQAELFSKIAVGDIISGVIKNVTDFGVFIDLGGVDGLIHITDLSWGRVNHPEEVVSLDQKLQVVILDFDEAKKRIALGLKQLTPHPWEALSAELNVGDKIKGKVVVVTDYGAFVEVAPGVEGLIHVSEMSWSQPLRSAQEFMKVGDEIEAVLLTLDREERKMSLGIKQLTPDPWADIENKYPAGTKCTARVRNFSNFGVFVEIEDGIEGLVHISDLSWTKKVKHPSEFTQVGAELEVVVLEINKENRRLSLGHKQLEENPWNGFESQFSVDSVHEGTVTEANDKGVVVSLGENIEGFCPARHAVKEDGTTLKAGETAEFKVLEFSKATKRITLSHSRIFEEAKRAQDAAEKAERRAAADAAKASVKKINAQVEKTTLGDIAGLAELKAQMENK